MEATDLWGRRNQVQRLRHWLVGSGIGKCFTKFKTSLKKCYQCNIFKVRRLEFSAEFVYLPLEAGCEHAAQLVELRPCFRRREAQ